MARWSSALHPSGPDSVIIGSNLIDIFALLAMNVWHTTVIEAYVYAAQIELAKQGNTRASYLSRCCVSAAGA